MPGAVYYPSFTVRLGVRFDEALHGVKLVPTVDQTASSLDPKIQTPLQLTRPNAKDGLSFKTQLTPTRCTVDIPGYRAAGKFTLEVPYRDFPFEPDIVRAIAVRIYAGAIPADQWASGNAGPGSLLGHTAGFANVRSSQLTPDDDRFSPGFNELLVGIADVIRVEHGEKGDVTHIEGRDLRGILIDIPAPLNLLATLNVTLPIHEVVQQIIDASPALTRSLGTPPIQVDTQEDEWPDGKIPAPNDPSVMTRVNLGAKGAPQPSEGQAGAAAKPMPVGQNGQLKLWDLITNFCQFVGAVPYFVGTQLRVRPARALWDPHKTPGFDPHFPTPFARGSPRETQGVNGQSYQITDHRVMVWGRNLLTLRRERKLGGQKVPTVVAVSMDTSPEQRTVNGKPGTGTAARHVEAQWPRADRPAAAGGAAAMLISSPNKKAKTTHVTADGSVVQNQAIYVSVPGIRDPKRLREIAKDIYEEIGRGELSGTASTADLASLGGDNGDPDLLRLRPGDPVRFEVDNRAMNSYPPPINAVSDLYRRDPEAMAIELNERLGDADLARVVAYSLTGRIAERQGIYRVSAARFSWDATKGVGIDFDFQNYVESRQGVTTAGTKKNKAKPIHAPAHGASRPI